MKKKPFTEAQILAALDRLYVANAADEDALAALEAIIKANQTKPYYEREMINYTCARIMILGQRLKRRDKRRIVLKRILGQLQTLPLPFKEGAKNNKHK